MTELQQKQLALLEETASFFNSENRCSDETGCKYFIEGKEGCAIGRLIQDKNLCKSMDQGTPYGKDYPDDILFGINNSQVFDRIPEDLKIYGISFLTRLQKLHDLSFNWVETGLSPDGEIAVRKIKNDFNLN